MANGLIAFASSFHKKSVLSNLSFVSDLILTMNEAVQDKGLYSDSVRILFSFDFPWVYLKRIYTAICLKARAMGLQENH